jgi:hypothetical protein
MRRLLKWLALLVSGIVLVLAAMFAWGRLRPPTAAQASSLAELQREPQPPPGRNAFPLLWFVDFDIPDDQLNGAYAKASRDLQAWAAKHHGTDTPAANLIPQPTSPFPVLAPLTDSDRALLCKWSEPDCLRTVRENADAVRAVLAKHQKRLQRDMALSNYGYEWNDLPRGVPFAMPLAVPNYGHSLGLWESAAALDFIDGRQAQALTSICTAVTTMRRMHAHGNTLVDTMIFGVRMQSAIVLTMQMVSELPLNQPLPDACNTAFATVTAEDVDLCPAQRTEFSIFTSELSQGHPAWYERWSLSIPHTQRLWATSVDSACTPETRAQLLADQIFTSKDWLSGIDVFDLVSNFSGSVLSGIVQPAYMDYLNREQDFAAALRVGATVLWLRQTHGQGQSLDKRLAQRPAWMQLAGDRELRVASDGRSLSMKWHLKSNRMPNSWPLPPGLLDDR